MLCRSTLSVATAWALGNKAKWATSHRAFPRNSTKRDPYAGFKQWIRHFMNNGDDDYGCYDPSGHAGALRGV